MEAIRKELPIAGVKARATNMMQVGDIRGVIDLLISKGYGAEYADFVYRRWEQTDPFLNEKVDIEKVIKEMKRDLSYVRGRLYQIIDRL